MTNTQNPTTTEMIARNPKTGPHRKFYLLRRAAELGLDALHLRSLGCVEIEEAIAQASR